MCLTVLCCILSSLYFTLLSQSSLPLRAYTGRHQTPLSLSVCVCVCASVGCWTIVKHHVVYAMSCRRPGNGRQSRGINVISVRDGPYRITKLIILTSHCGVHTSRSRRNPAASHQSNRLSRCLTTRECVSGIYRSGHPSLITVAAPSEWRRRLAWHYRRFVDH